MVVLDQIRDAARPWHLDVAGHCAPAPQDPCPPGTRAIVLLGPLEPGFWAYASSAPEFHDTRPDPMDRWSARAIGALADQVGATALFPFSGPPYLPFQNWAQRSGRAWVSPVGMLVHDTAGLWVSFRGALALPDVLPAPPGDLARPCESCRDRPCLTACPVAALGATGYDTGACHGHLATVAGQDCRTQGCRARRACPVSQSFGRAPAQSEFHMKAFHPCPTP